MPPAGELLMKRKQWLYSLIFVLLIGLTVAAVFCALAYFLF